MSAQHAHLGEYMWTNSPKLNSEVVAMTYGAIVTEILRDMKDVAIVNAELEKLGRNIGTRMVDEFLAKTGITNCKDFRATADVIAKTGFKAYLGISADVKKWSENGLSCSIVFPHNPLMDFVELPEECKELQYSNILCGVIVGALSMVRIEASCEFVKDELKGADLNEIRVNFVEVVPETFTNEE